MSMAKIEYKSKLFIFVAPPKAAAPGALGSDVPKPNKTFIGFVSTGGGGGVVGVTEGVVVLIVGFVTLGVTTGGVTDGAVTGGVTTGGVVIGGVTTGGVTTLGVVVVGVVVEEGVIPVKFNIC